MTNSSMRIYGGVPLFRRCRRPGCMGWIPDERLVDGPPWPGPGISLEDAINISRLNELEKVSHRRVLYLPHEGTELDDAIDFDNVHGGPHEIPDVGTMYYGKTAPSAEDGEETTDLPVHGVLHAKIQDKEYLISFGQADKFLLNMSAVNPGFGLRMALGMIETCPGTPGRSTDEFSDMANSFLRGGTPDVWRTEEVEKNKTTGQVIKIKGAARKNFTDMGESHPPKKKWEYVIAEEGLKLPNDLIIESVKPFLEKLVKIHRFTEEAMLAHDKVLLEVQEESTPKDRPIDNSPVPVITELYPHVLKLFVKDLDAADIHLFYESVEKSIAMCNHAFVPFTKPRDKREFRVGVVLALCGLVEYGLLKQVGDSAFVATRMGRKILREHEVFTNDLLNGLLVDEGTHSFAAKNQH